MGAAANPERRSASQTPSLHHTQACNLGRATQLNSGLNVFICQFLLPRAMPTFYDALEKKKEAEALQSRLTDDKAK